MITYQLEPWDRYYTDPDRAKLWLEHYTEFAPAHEGKMNMAPDVSVYEAIERAGQLQITVARKAGKMIGYCLVVVRPHIHYSRTLCAFEDSYFVTANERHGLVGYRLLQRALRFARERGAARAYFMTKEFNSIRLLFARMGMTKIDEVWACWLGGM